ncbi:MAG: hypothetical protein NC341_12080 [Blautia sp.]|nr:hypothetical protein [Blautia sp.]MCM1200355.1 hypothetical protein [Bacteroides fragilis]
MKFPFFASFLVFTAWLTYEISKHNRIDAEKDRSFWEKERRANNTRRRPLDDLSYIKIPFERLSMELLPEDEQAAEYKETLRTLDESEIVNFTGISNTDLKLKYGAPNIDLLSKYDQNYTILARTLNQWASYLYKKGYRKEAREVLEFAVSTGTDVSGTYKLLCEIYKEENTPEKIKELYPTAEALNSAMKNAIIRILRESGQ